VALFVEAKEKRQQTAVVVLFLFHCVSA